jgi:hypothetical protein
VDALIRVAKHDGVASSLVSCVRGPPTDADGDTTGAAHVQGLGAFRLPGAIQERVDGGDRASGSSNGLARPRARFATGFPEARHSSFDKVLSGGHPRVARKFKHRGTFRYCCRFHRSLGMRAR